MAAIDRIGLANELDEQIAALDFLLENLRACAYRDRPYTIREIDTHLQAMAGRDCRDCHDCHWLTTTLAIAIQRLAFGRG
jgi:hypothetical protein